MEGSLPPAAFFLYGIMDDEYAELQTDCVSSSFFFLANTQDFERHYNSMHERQMDYCIENSPSHELAVLMLPEQNSHLSWPLAKVTFYRAGCFLQQIEMKLAKHSGNYRKCRI